MDGDKLEEMNLVCKMMQEVGSRGDAKYIEKNDQWELLMCIDDYSVQCVKCCTH